MGTVDLNGELGQVALGCIGAIVSEALHWHRIARRGRWPQYAHSLSYWFVTFLIILLGGIISATVSPPGTTATQVLLMGAVGPQLIDAVARSRRPMPQPIEPHLGVSRDGLLEFLSS